MLNQNLSLTLKLIILLKYQNIFKKTMINARLQQNTPKLHCLCPCCNPFKKTNFFEESNYDQSECLFSKIRLEYFKRIENNITMKKIFILECDVSNSLKEELTCSYDLSITARSSIGLIHNKEYLLNKDFIDECIILNKHCRQIQNKKGLAYITHVWSEVFSKTNYLIDYNMKNYNRLDKELAKSNVKAKNLVNVGDLYSPDCLYYIIVPNLGLL